MVHSRLLSNLLQYLTENEQPMIWPQLLVFAGMAYSLFKFKSYTYKFIGMFCKQRSIQP